MGGTESSTWLQDLDAVFEAAVAREEEVAARDLAFSLRQDVDLNGAVARSRGAWVLAGRDGAAAPVDEVGADYVRAGATLVPTDRAVLRSVPGSRPAVRDRSLLETMNAACRAGADAAIEHSAGTTSGRLLRVAKDHVAVRNGAGETIVGLGAIASVRLGLYSASRGFSG